LSDLPNVVLLVFDAMRKDVLGAYNGRGVTPNLNAFSQEATAFPDCISPSPWTIPSHISLFAGNYPSEHGVHETGERKAVDLLGMPAGVKGTMLAEVLKSKGYQTIGIPVNPMLTLRSGFSRGFESFKFPEGELATPEEMSLVRETFEQGRSRGEIVWKFLRRGQLGKLVRLYSVTRRIRRFRKESDFPRSKYGNLVVEKVRRARIEPPYFLFANFMEMHDPYVGYEMQAGNRGPFPTVGLADLYGYRALQEDVLREIRDGYYSNASRLDTHFGALVSVLKEKGAFDNTLWVLTSDHGQALKERGYYGHGTFLHDEILRVPLLVKRPYGKKLPPAEGYQSLTNVRSFVIESIEGGDAGPALDRESAIAESFGIQQSPPPNLDAHLAEKVEEVRRRVDRPLKAVYRGGFRLVVETSTLRVEEFSQGVRPVDAAAHPRELEAMMTELESVKEAPAAPAPSALTPSEESSISERLRELGYL